MSGQRRKTGCTKWQALKEVLDCEVSSSFGGQSGLASGHFSLPLHSLQVATAVFVRFTKTSSYCSRVSKPSVTLLLSSNLGSTTAM